MLRNIMTMFIKTDTRRQFLHRSSICMRTGHGYFLRAQTYKLDRTHVKHGRIDTDGVKSHIEQYVTSCKSQLLDALRLVNVDDYDLLKYDGIVFTKGDEILLSIKVQDNNYLSAIVIDIETYMCHVYTLADEYVKNFLYGSQCLVLVAAGLWYGVRIYS